MIFIPFVAAFLFAFMQLGYYALLKRLEKIEGIPFFGVLLFRGLIISIALSSGLAIALHYSGAQPFE